MNIFNSSRYSQLEEELYEKVANEIIQDNIDKGLWAKAFSNSEGDENKTKSLYIKYKVEKLLKDLRKEKLLKKKQDEKDYHVRQAKIKDEKSLHTLITLPDSLLGEFIILLFLLILSSLSLIAWAFYSKQDSGFLIIYSFIGVIVLLVGLYLLNTLSRNRKGSTIEKNEVYLGRMFGALIPFSMIVLIVGFAVCLIAGVFASLIFVSLIVSLFKFSSASNHVKKKDLIKKYTEGSFL